MPEETTINTDITPTEPVQSETIQTPPADPTPTPEATPVVQEAPSPTPTTFTTPEMTPEAPEAPRNDDIPKSSDIPENTVVNKEETEKTSENTNFTSTQPEIVTNTPESSAPTASTFTETSVGGQTQLTEPIPTKEELKVIETVIASTTTDRFRALFAKAREVIQFRKRKKLDRIMTLFLKKSHITNDDIEKFLHVSDATAGRYLSILEKEGKIKRHGKTGQGVTYSRL